MKRILLPLLCILLYTASNAQTNNALHFDGVDDNIELGLQPITPTSFTIEAWVNGASFNNSGRFNRIVAINYGSYSDDNPFCLFVMSTGKIGYVFGSGTATFDSKVPISASPTLSINTWYHVAFTFDGTSKRLYVNGVLAETVNNSSTFTNPNNEPLLIGDFKINESNNGEWEGKLDEVRIWNRALSAAEILASKDQCVSATANGLVAYYDFQEGNPNGDNSATGTNITQVIDKVNGNNGTLNGFTRSGTASNFVPSGFSLSCAEAIALSGNGETIANAGTPLASNHTDFGKLAPSTSVTRTFTITNTGTANLVLNASPVTLSGSSDFTLVAQPATLTLAPNASTTFQITFTPTTSGTKTATVSIASTDPSSPFTFEVQGSTNTALDFDGANDHVFVIAVMSTSYTKEAWVKRSGTGNNNIISGGTAADFGNHAFWAPPGYSFKLSAGHNGTWNAVQDPNALTAGVWYHVAVVYDAANQDMFLYKNGVLVASNFNVPDYNRNGTGANTYIGAYSAGNFFVGSIDEVRIWNRALCAQEILGRMNSSLQGNESGLIVYYDFEEGVPNGTNTALTQVLDKANNKHGNLVNFAKTGTTSNWVVGTELTSDGLIQIAATFNTWLGTTNDWNTPTNWDNGFVPSRCDDVLIPVTANNPIISNNQAVNNVVIDASATLTIAPGGCFSVGSSILNNGNFILEANSSSYAQYQGPQVKGTLSQVISEAGWHNISSPFVDAKLSDITFTNGGFLQFGAADKCNINYYNSDTYQGGVPTDWTTSWGSWECAANGDEAFNGSKAYTLFLDAYFATSFPVTMTVTGTLRNMPLTQELKKSNGGWNQLSNPFPSVVDFDKLYDNSTIGNSYRLWDAAANGGLGQYKTYMVGGSSSPGGLTRYIAPYQSVFVKTSGSATVDPISGETLGTQPHLISNADRPTSCPSAINEFYKTELTGELHLEIKATNNSFSDELAIRFGNGYSEGFVADEEAIKFFSPVEEVPQIYTIIENKPYVISSFPQPDVVIQHIPLGVKALQNKSLQIAALEIPEGITAILEDKEKGVFHNLKIAYSFTATSNLDNARFVLHLGDSRLTANQLGATDDYIAFLKDGSLQFIYNVKMFGGDAQLMNINGQVLAKMKVEENGSISVAHLPIGLYFISVENEGKVYTQKMVIK